MSIDCTLQRRCISNTEQNSRPIIYKTDHSIWNTSLLSISALYLSKVPGPDFSIASLLYILTLFPKNKKIKKKKKDYLLYFLKKKPTHAHEKLVHLSSTFICHFPLIYIEIIHFTIKSPILWWSRKCTCFFCSCKLSEGNTIAPPFETLFLPHQRPFTAHPAGLKTFWNAVSRNEQNKNQSAKS